MVRNKLYWLDQNHNQCKKKKCRNNVVVVEVCDDSILERNTFSWNDVEKKDNINVIIIIIVVKDDYDDSNVFGRWRNIIMMLIKMLSTSLLIVVDDQS